MIGFWVGAVLVASAAGPDWASVEGNDGWTSVGESKTDETGVITISTKEVGTTCLRGVATLKAPTENLIDVITDVPAAPKFSREKLLMSKVLGKDGPKTDYVQVLDVPGWTMASDRFWVLRGERFTAGAVSGYRWNRFDWAPVYPALVDELAAVAPKGIEPMTNWGQWAFEQAPDGTKATYVLCSDAGGSLPAWVQRAAATRTLPATMADVAREALRRASK